MTAKDQLDLRDLYDGLGDGLARGIEMVVTPGLFGLAGYAIDRTLGLIPLFTIALLVVALVGMFVRLWAQYDQEMQAHDQTSVWSRSRGGAPS